MSLNDGYKKNSLGFFELICGGIKALILIALISSSLYAADLSLEERVTKLEDREAIRTLLLSYGKYVDERNWQDFSALFSVDAGTWNGGMGIAKGRSEIISMMEGSLGTGNNVGSNGEGMSNLHLLGNEFINVEGLKASALSKWVFVMTKENGGPDIVYVGHYVDELVKEDGEWKFKLRTVFGDITQSLELGSE